MKQKAAPPSRGFTLVELIVVLGIIIGLSTAVFGFVQSAQTSSEVSHLMRDADLVRSAIVSYGLQKNGNYSGLDERRWGGRFGGSYILVRLGLLPERFEAHFDDFNFDNNENPFSAHWLIDSKGDSGYQILVLTNSNEGATLIYDKWKGDVECALSGWDVSCNFEG